MDEDLESGHAQLFRRVAEIDFALRAGYTLTWADITPDEFAAHRILREESDRWQEEQLKRPQPKWSSID